MPSKIKVKHGIVVWNRFHFERFSLFIGITIVGFQKNGLHFLSQSIRLGYPSLALTLYLINFGFLPIKKISFFLLPESVTFISSHSQSIFGFHISFSFPAIFFLSIGRPRFRKQHRGRMKGISYRGNHICFGKYAPKPTQHPFDYRESEHWLSIYFHKSTALYYLKGSLIGPFRDFILLVGVESFRQHHSPRSTRIGSTGHSKTSISRSSNEENN